MNMTAEIAHNIRVFLDRAEIKGHQERGMMNEVVLVLDQIVQPTLTQAPQPTEGDAA